MEMGMQEPGDMCCDRWHGQEPATTERKQKKTVGLHDVANHIIISCRSISLSS
jgi:hypothetical protein